MIEEDLLANIIHNRTDEIMSSEKLSTKEKIARLDELRILFQSILFRNEIINLYDELSESQ